MSRKITVFSRLIFFLGMIRFCDIPAQEHSYEPDEGFVPDQTTAAILAEAILKPIYGDENIDRQKPFKVILKNKVWVITGTLPEGLMGG